MRLGEVGLDILEAEARLAYENFARAGIELPRLHPDRLTPRVGIFFSKKF